MNHFKLCSTCKTPISFEAKYYKCSVSTCNKKATALFFCSVPCWDAHVPDARHRDAWAEEETAPSASQAAAMSSEERATAPRRVVAGRAAQGSAAQGSTTPDSTTAPPLNVAEVDDAQLPRDVLVVMSKLKGYIKAKSEMRTSDGVSDPLSNHLRAICTRAIRSAAENGRGTVLARDIEAATQGRSASE